MLFKYLRIKDLKLSLTFIICVSLRVFKIKFPVYFFDDLVCLEVWVGYMIIIVTLGEYGFLQLGKDGLEFQLDGLCFIPSYKDIFLAYHKVLNHQRVQGQIHCNAEKQQNILLIFGNFPCYFKNGAFKFDWY